MQNCFILLEPLHVGVCCWGDKIGRGWEEGHAGMETVVSEEGGQGSGRMLRIVIAEFCHVQQAGPVRPLIVAVDVKVLFEHRIQPLRLAICLGMEG